MLNYPPKPVKYPYTTKGYNLFHVVSALQKEVRRGHEDDALYWAMELMDSGHTPILHTRLYTIAHEDIGVGDMLAAMFALRALDDAETSIKNGKTGRLQTTNAVLALCRAVKCRDGDNGHIATNARRAKEQLGIPDYALDKHTIEGKKAGRGIEHFANVAAILGPQDVSRLDWKNTLIENYPVHQEWMEAIKNPAQAASPAAKVVSKEPSVGGLDAWAAEPPSP